MKKNYCRSSLYCSNKSYNTCQSERFCKYKLTSSNLVISNLDEFDKIINIGYDPIKENISIQFTYKEIMMFTDNIATFYRLNNIEKFKDLYSVYQFIFNYYKKLLNGIDVEKKLAFEWYEYIFDNYDFEQSIQILDDLYPNLETKDDNDFLY